LLLLPPVTALSLLFDAGTVRNHNDAFRSTSEKRTQTLNSSERPRRVGSYRS